MFALLVYVSLCLVLCPKLTARLRTLSHRSRLFAWLSIFVIVRKELGLRFAVTLALIYLSLSPRVTPWPYEHFLFGGRELFYLSDRGLSEQMESAGFKDVSVFDETWKTPHGELHVVRVERASAPLDVVVVVSQGIAGNIGGHMSLLKLLTESGAREVVIYEPRGFGLSHFASWSPARIPTYFGGLEHVSIHSMVEDAYDVMQLVKQRDAVRLRPIVWWGESFGASVVSYLATRNGGNVEAVVLQSGFKSAADIGYDRRDLPVRFNPCRIYPRWLYPRELNTIKWLKGEHPPVLLIHGERDRIVPCQHSCDVKAAASGSCRLVLLPDSRHVQLATRDRALAVSTVNQFIGGVLCRR
ncbi:MAG TPA: alpha/beta fold hydrolase [Oculatellaceae cyanobacterium]